MGYLTEKYVKNKSTTYKIYIVLDIILIFSFLFFALTIRGEFDNGAKFILTNVPAYCTNNTLYKSTLEYYGLNMTSTTKPHGWLEVNATENISITSYSKKL